MKFSCFFRSRHVVFVFFFCLMCQTSLCNAMRMIRNGKQVLSIEEEIPQMVSLRRGSVTKGSTICGGLVIGRRHVLSAAHCEAKGAHWAVIGELASTGNVEKGFRSLIKRSYLPDEYDQEALFAHDFMVYELEEAIPSHIEPMRLLLGKEEETRVVPGAQVTVYGYGKTSPEASTGSSVLQKAEMIIWDRKRCIKAYEEDEMEIHHSMFCARGEQDQVTCQGDSGSPVIMQTKKGGKKAVVGVVSWGKCGENGAPSVFGRLSHALNFLYQHVPEVKEAIDKWNQAKQI